MDLVKIAGAFKLNGNVEKVEKFGDGLINSTYRIVTDANAKNEYILQDINNAIFKNVDELSQNIVRITDHIKGKLSSIYSTDELERRVLNVVYTHEGNSFAHIDNKYWRVFYLIEGSKTVENLESFEQAKSAGKAFAEFQGMLRDLNNPPLFETLPGFHNTAMRIDNFKKTVDKDPVGRVAEVKEEIDFLLQFEDEMKSIVRKGDNGELPLRVVHQDTKLSNILFDSKSGDALCVIDLDTTMPGYLCYDFGDAVRGSMNNGKEDDENLNNVGLNMELFKGFASGYYEGSKGWISKEEIETLAFGAKLLTYEQSVRFLDDYIDGDNYYKTFKEKHNLIRARAQMAYFKDLNSKFDQINTFVKELYK
jgi:Ser/Thr protein kinase RdoA (MazF antagonist)